MNSLASPVATQQTVSDPARAPFWSWPAKVLVLLGVVPVVVALVVGIETVLGALILALPIALWTMLLLMWIATASRAAAGALVGYRLERFVIGPVAIYRRDSGWLITGNANLEAIIGDTASIDPRGAFPVARTKLYIRGGTIGALAGGVALWMLWVALVDPDATYPPIVWCAQLATIVAAIAVFLIIAALDTYLISRIKKVGAQGVHNELRFHMTRQNKGALGSRPRPNEWHRETIVRMAVPGRFPVRSTRALHDAYQHFLDSGDVNTAWSYLSKAFAAAVPMSIDRTRIHLEYAYMQAYYRRRPDLARTIFDNTPTDDNLRHVSLRAEAAILVAEGKTQQGLDAAMETLRAISRLGNPSQEAAETERIAFILSGIDEPERAAAG